MHFMNSPIFSKIASLAMDQSHCYSDAGEVIAEDIVKTGRYKPQQYTT